MTGRNCAKCWALRAIPRLSPGLIVAVAALLVGLGGSSYAAFRLGAGSVGTKQLKNGAVTGPKLANSAVAGPKLATGAVTSGALANGAVTSLKLAPGAVGSAQVHPGAGVNLTYETSSSYQVAAGSTAAIYQSCPSGTSAISGGALPDDPHVTLIGAGPYNTSTSLFGGPANAWAAYLVNNDTTTHSFVVFAVCITAGAVH